MAERVEVESVSSMEEKANKNLETSDEVLKLDVNLGGPPVTLQEGQIESQMCFSPW